MFEELFNESIDELNELNEKVDVIEQHIKTNDNINDVIERVEAIANNINTIEKRLEESYKDINKVKEVVKDYESIKNTIEELRAKLKKYDNLPKVIEDKIYDLNKEFNNKYDEMNNINSKHKEEVNNQTNELKEIVNNNNRDVELANKKVSNIKKYLGLSIVSIIAISSLSFIVLSNKVYESIDVSNKLDNDIKKIDDKFKKVDLSNYVNKSELSDKDKELNENIKEFESKFTNILNDKVKQIELNDKAKDKEIEELKRTFIERLSNVDNVSKTNESIKPIETIDEVEKVVIKPIINETKPIKKVVYEKPIEKPFYCFLEIRDCINKENRKFIYMNKLYSSNGKFEKFI